MEYNCYDIRFLNMQKVILLLSARIFLVPRSSQLRGRKIGRSQHHVNYFRQEDPSKRHKRGGNGGEGGITGLGNITISFGATSCKDLASAAER